MYPVLFSIGNFPVSSFGMLLAFGIFLGGFTVWRVGRGYDIDAEKILDIIFLTVGAGFVFSRLVFVLLNLPVFDSLAKIVFLNRYPGFSFWGGLVGGIFVLSWLSKKFRISYLQAGDFAVVGFFIAAAVAELGCLLGGCGIGVETNSFFGVDQVGVIGKRVPVQLVEAAAFFVLFLAFWRTILKFYVQGSIFAKGIIFLAVIKLSAVFFKSPHTVLRIGGVSLNLDIIFPALVLGLGLLMYYKVNKKTPFQDLKAFFRFFTDGKVRSQVVTKFYKGCYNHWVNLGIGLNKTRKRIFKLLNIRSNPENFKK
jgi:prolipoprotein diacylglyceryltransferase